MTYEEALEYAKSYITLEGIPVSARESTACIVDALEKQIPKKPRHEHLNFYCPNCGNWLLWDDAEPNDNDLFCPKCGQHILWEDEE